MRLLLKLIGFGLNTLSWIAPKRAARLAILLFTKPPKPRIRQKEQDFLNQARTEKLRDTVRYHWGDDPSAPYILLAYGWGYNAGRWRHFVPFLLEAGYRVIAYDPPGHGHSVVGTLTLPSNAEIVKDIIRSEGKPSAIIGHSFGGSASILAINSLPPSLHPNRVVTMASFSEAEGVFRDFQKRLGMREGLYQDYVRLIERRIGNPLQSYDLARLASKYHDVRGLIVHALQDEVTAFYHAERYVEFWSNSLLLATKEGGHHLGVPWITEAVCTFAANGNIPKDATVSDRIMPGDHDLSRYFAGMKRES